MRIQEIASDERLVEIESDILSAKSLLKLRGIPQDYYKRNRSLRLVIDDILWKNQNCDTVYVSNGSIQCTPGRRRSQGDLFKIVRYYKPEVTFKQFRKALFSLVNNRKVSTLFCGDIHKRVFVKNRLGYQVTPVCYSEYTVDELGFTLVPIPPNTYSYRTYNDIRIFLPTQ